MDLPPNVLHPSPVQKDENDEHSAVKRVLQGSAIPCTTILEQMPDAFLALDTQWRITSFNSQAEALLKQPRAELLGRSIWEAIPNVGDTPFFHSCQQARTTGKAVSFEYLSPVVNKWFHIHVSPAEGGICAYFQNITERKQAEEIIRQSELRFRAIFNQSFTFLGVMTPDGLLIDVNELALTATGFQREEVIGLHIWEAGWLRSLPHEASLLKKAVSQASAGQTVQFEIAYLTNDGKKRIAAVVIKPLLNETGDVVYVIAEGNDITERKQAEERLRQSEKHFRALVENNADGIALTDEHGIITYASPSTMHMVGFPPEEIVGGRIFGREDYPDGGEATRRLMARVLEEPRKSLVLEIRTGHKNGTFLWMEVVGINLLHEPGVEAIVWNFRDVTQRKQLEQEVISAKEQLEVILQNVADGITVVDPNDRLVYVNDIAAHRLGFPSLAALLAAQQAGKVHRHEKFTVWDEWGRPNPASERPTDQAMRGKPAKALLQYQDNPTGPFYWSLVRAHPILDAQGQVQFVVTVYTDVTEQKELEQRKDHFISMASHELKTPLTVLSAFTQLLLEQFAAEERQDVVRQLSKMDHQITNLTKLVADLLDISRMQAGQLELAQEAVDIDELVHEVVENLQPTTTHHLLIEGAAQQPIIGDRDRLGQVLIILLTNAIKYSPHADTVFVRLKHTQDALTVSVHDLGIGIAQSHQQKLFQRFYRVLSKKDQTYPGLGIGLYIAHEIIERHGGKMWVESVEGKESTFYFSLPLREERESTS